MRARQNRRKMLAAAAALALAGGCATPLELGEQRYQQGDREGALDVWRDIDAAELDYASARARIEAVSDEHRQLVTRYKQRARYFEAKARLAEAVLDYRLALRLEPGDRETLAHVQELVRRLAKAREQGLAQFHVAFEREDLAAARVHVASLRNLDPFSPEVNDGHRRLEEALSQRLEAGLSRGRAAFSANDLERADREFQKVLELDPRNESARGYLAYIDRLHTDQAGRADAPEPGDALFARPALVDERRILSASEAEIRAEGFLQNALAAEASGDPFQAIRYDLAALKAYARHAGARSHLAAVRRALSPQVAGLIEAGRRHYQREDLQAALEEWQRALLIDPENREARDNAGRAEKMLERLEALRSEQLSGTAQP